MPTTNGQSDVFKLIDIGRQTTSVGGGWELGVDVRMQKGVGHTSWQRRQRKVAYRWVFELVNGVELTPNQLVCHSCDQWKLSCRLRQPLHITLGTNQDNKDDAVKRERVGYCP